MSDHNKPLSKIIGNGWMKATEHKGVYINIQVSKEQLLELPTDKFGNYCLTIAPKKIVGDMKPTHIVYEDEYRRNKEVK